MFLTPAETAVLEVLHENNWMTPVEVCEHEPAADLHPQVVRGALKQLTSHRLVERGGWGDSMRWGEFRITQLGRNRINTTHQLRLI